jgi:drug/metabolite transporter (DMT)-like permease
VILAAFVGSFGAVCLKSGAARLEFKIGALLRNWPLALGVVLFLFSSVLFVLGIRNGELTILYPMASLNYVFTLIWSRIFFKEALTPNKFAGLALILAGVVCLGLGNRL